MEFYSKARVHLPVRDIQKYVRIADLPQWCASIRKVLSQEGERGEIVCAWGTFRVRREVIRDGVRFTLPGCPHALQWTITLDTPSDPQQLVVHCTIKQTEVEATLRTTLERFVDDWRIGLESCLPRIRAAQSSPAGEEMPWYG